MLCIGVNKIKIPFDTSQLCSGVVHFTCLKAGCDFCLSEAFRKTLLSINLGIGHVKIDTKNEIKTGHCQEIG
jgi:hypothetical protein